MIFNGENLENWTFFVSNSDVEPGDLFWVEDGMINTTGKPHGYIRTKDTYSNYKLHMEWRWTEEPTNSGVLIHVQGKDMKWPHCIECQLMHEHAGDLVLMGKGAGVTIRDSTYLIISEEKRYAVIPKFEDASESPAGEWNSYDITSQNGEIKVVVNGVLQHTGTEMTPTEGNILLQSEGSPMQFRNIYLEHL
ncbi:MAG: DUF1080 domain-containing protein [Deltaproteobacteria bacterium]|nr:DUF1080 domain-containing protein [Deltaproteobacteria bacterium]